MIFITYFFFLNNNHKYAIIFGYIFYTIADYEFFMGYFMITKILIKKTIIFSSIILIAAIFTACSFSNQEASENGSVYFVIDENMEHSIRTAIGRAHNGTANARYTSTAISKEDLYIDVSLKGGYEETITVPVKAGETASFENIPAGLSLYAEAKAYFIEGGEKVVFYEGKSPTVTIEGSEIFLPVSLKKNKNPEAWGERIYIHANLDIPQGDRDGSKEKPYDSMMDALTSLIERTTAHAGEEIDYIFIVQGELPGRQRLSKDEVGEFEANSIILKGEDSSAAFTDPEEDYPSLYVNLDTIPLTIKNITFRDNTTDFTLSLSSDVSIGRGVILDGNEDGISIDSSILYLSENIKINNISNNGHGITINGEGAKVVLSGNAKLIGKNDIKTFQEGQTGPFVIVGGILTESAPIASLIPRNYNSGTPMLGAEEGIPLQYEKFTVPPCIEFDPVTYWKIDTSGNLKQIFSVRITRTDTLSTVHTGDTLSFAFTNIDEPEDKIREIVYYWDGSFNSWEQQGDTTYSLTWEGNVCHITFTEFYGTQMKIYFGGINFEQISDNDTFEFQAEN